MQKCEGCHAGSLVYALDAFKAAGVDLTTPEPLDRALASLVEVVDRLEALVLYASLPRPYTSSRDKPCLGSFERAQDRLRTSSRRVGTKRTD